MARSLAHWDAWRQATPLSLIPGRHSRFREQSSGLPLQARALCGDSVLRMFARTALLEETTQSAARAPGDFKNRYGAKANSLVPKSQHLNGFRALTQALCRYWYW